MRKTILAAALALGACGEGAIPPPRAGYVPLPRADAPPAPVPANLAAIQGATAQRLIARFGKPQLDMAEGTTRKLQFAGPNCILDIYLYPPESGSGPARATYIAAHNPQGGSVDAQSCSTAIANR